MSEEINLITYAIFGCGGGMLLYKPWLLLREYIEGRKMEYESRVRQLEQKLCREKIKQNEEAYQRYMNS